MYRHDQFVDAVKSRFRSPCDEVAKQCLFHCAPKGHNSIFSFLRISTVLDPIIAPTDLVSWSRHGKSCGEFWVRPLISLRALSLAAPDWHAHDLPIGNIRALLVPGWQWTPEMQEGQVSGTVGEKSVGWNTRNDQLILSQLVAFWGFG